MHVIKQNKCSHSAIDQNGLQTYDRDIVELIHYTDFKTFLQQQFQSRIAKNSNYSMRAFARDLGIAPPQLSCYLRGKRGLSYVTAEKILDQFKLSSLQKKFLLSSILKEFGRSDKKRGRGNSDLLQYNSSHYHALKDDEFRVVSDWQHLAILTLMELPQFHFDLEWIANQLGIGVETVGLAIGRMLGLKMISLVDGRLQKSASYVSYTVDTSEANQNFHQQVLDKHASAIKGRRTSDRILNSGFISIDESQIGEVRLFIDEFCDAFDQKFSMHANHMNKNSVYSFGIQFCKVCNVTDQAGVNPSEKPSTKKQVG